MPATEEAILRSELRWVVVVTGVVTVIMLGICAVIVVALGRWIGNF